MAVREWYVQAFQVPQTFHPITTVHVDRSQNLIWIGNSSGNIRSYTHTAEDYCAFRVLDSNREQPVPINGITSFGDAMCCASPGTLEVHSKQGVLLNACPDNFTSVVHPAFDPKANLVACTNNSIRLYDIENFKETSSKICNNTSFELLGVSINYIIAGSGNGAVAIFDRSSLNQRDCFKHCDSLSDINIQDNRIVTCGANYNSHHFLRLPYVNVYDIRMRQKVMPVECGGVPVFCRFLYQYSDAKIMVVNQDSSVCILDINTMEREAVLPPNYEINFVDMDISVDGNSASFITSQGHIYSISRNEGNLIYPHAPRLKVADDEMSTMFIAIDDQTTSLAEIPFPYPQDDWLLSDFSEKLWEPKFWFPPPKIEATHYYFGKIGCPNPYASRKLRNVVPYTSNLIEKQHLTIPQFYLPDLNKQIRECNILPQIYNDYLQALNTSKYSQFYPTETSGPINSVLWLILSIKPVQNMIRAHFCDKDNCLACEMCFIFNALDEMYPRINPTTHNLLEIMRIRGMPHLEESTLVSPGTLLDWLFIELSKDLTQAEQLIFNTLFMAKKDIRAKCHRCEKFTQHEESLSILKLGYPAGHARTGFTTLLEKSLIKSQNSTRHCDHCKIDTMQEQISKLKKIPPVFLVKANVLENMSYWQSRLAEQEKNPPYSKPTAPFVCKMSEHNICPKGNFCFDNLTCKFEHPPDWNTWNLDINATLAKSKAPDNWESLWSHVLPQHVYIRLQQGILVISESEIEDSEEYVLCGMTLAIGKAFDHAVAEVCTFEEGTRKWCVANDLMMTAVPEDEALHLNTKWKLPSLITFVRKSLMIISPKIPRPGDSNYQHPKNYICVNPDIYLTWVPLEHGHNDVLKMHTTFVKYNGRHLLIRFKLTFDKSGKTFCDDYIHYPHVRSLALDEEASGVALRDLYPETTTKCLLSYKVLVFKLHWLNRLGFATAEPLNPLAFANLNVHLSDPQFIS